jgi:hypothetical protein
MRLISTLAVLALSLAAAPAFAEEKVQMPAAPGRIELGDGGGNKDKAVVVLKMTIEMLEGRVRELEHTKEFDDREARELDRHAEGRERTANAMAARAKEYRDLAALFPAGDTVRAELETIAKDLDIFAGKDREFAADRRKAAQILKAQAASAAEDIKADRAAIERYKQIIGKMK